MKRLSKYSELPWNHEFWSVVRYYRSLRIRNKEKQRLWLESQLDHDSSNRDVALPITAETLDVLKDYIADSEKTLESALSLLRTEQAAKAFCIEKKLSVGSTTTKNQTHHQSSKSLVSAVSGIAERVCGVAKSCVDIDPQRRAVWFSENGLHVSARNLDGAIPSLKNPSAIWEIKEYWGKTKGGSKMSDAVYECHLVGLELRTFESVSDVSIQHIVFVDGRDQWGHRKSDLQRFIDLHQQGLIDHLIVGREVENEWEELLSQLV